MRVAIVTNFPSSYQVDLFNALSCESQIDLKVFYLRKLTPGRQWTKLKTINHDHQFIRELRLDKNAFYLSPGLVRAVINFNPDVLIITQYANIGMQLLMYLWSFLRRPWIFWAESPGVQFTELPIVKNEASRRLFRRLALLPLKFGPTQVWGIGNQAQILYSKYTKIKTFNVPYYFDPNDFLRIERPTSSQEDNYIKFLWVGKLVYRKGFDLLLGAVDELSQKRKDFRVVVMGDGPQRNLINDLPSDVQQMIEFVGFKELSDVPATYAESDVLVFPTRYDGWGVAVMEGLASGMPVIASKGSICASEILTDGCAGILFSVEDINTLVSAMNELLDDRNLVIKMGLVGREYVKSYSAKVGAHNIAYLLNNNI